MKKQLQILWVALTMFAVGIFTAAPAAAAAIDVTSVVSEIGSQAAPIALVGAAVLILYVGVKAFKWVRHALS